MKFSKFFGEWLYGEDGYYLNYKTIGKDGDFYTAVSASKFFGGSIANYIIKVIESGYLPNNTTIMEIGAHKGYLLADIIQFIFTIKPELLKTLNFAIVEPFEKLQETQRNYFKESFEDEVKLIHYSDLEDVSLDNAFIVANEIFDAFPCELIKDNKMLLIDDNLNKEFVKLDNYCENIVETYKIKTGEITIGFEEFGKKLKKAIKKFEFVTFDYGENYPRNDFSIRVYKEHKTLPFFDDKMIIKDYFKISDITYDVNFKHLIDSFKSIGIDCNSYKTQLTALIDFGLIELLEILKENVNESTYLREVNKVKTLIEPTMMGERFKMVSFRKDKNER